MAAWVDGQTTDVESAVGAAADLLLRARMPVLAGLSADVDALRAALRLAGMVGASLDPLGAPNLYGELAPLASSATMRTTPGEAVGRADVVLSVGTASASPILREIEASRPAFGPAMGAERSVLVLGGSPEARSNRQIAYPLEPGGLAATLGLLRSLAGGRIARESPLAELAGRLRGARYGVILYDPGELGDLGVEMLHGLVTELNDTARFFALPLADAWQGRALVQVGAWTTGQGPRIGFGRLRPEHDPWRFDAARQVAAGEADAVLWIAATPAPQPSWSRDLPTVALLPEAGGREGTVVFAVGVPGESSDGVLWDERRDALVFRQASRPDQRPSAAAILSAVAERVERAQGAS